MALFVKLARKDELNRRLRRLPDAAQQHVRKAVEKSADELVDLAKVLAPKETGELAKSIRPEVDPDGLSARVGSDIRYAQFVEFGTQGRPATPYLFPAYRALRNRIRGRIGRAVKKATDQARK